MRQPELADGDVQAPGCQNAVAGQLFHVRCARILGQVTDLARARYLARCGQSLAGKDPREGGLACTVTAYEADLVALVDAEAHLVHEEPGASAQFKILDSNHSR